MISRDVIERLRTHVSGRVETNASLAPFSTYRIGGPAAVLVIAETTEDIQLVAEVTGGVGVEVIGKGSNTLVADAGFDGLALVLGASFRGVTIDGGEVTIGGATPLPSAARTVARAGLTGYEWAAEIPGTFGGAVMMNAGAHGVETADVLQSVDVVNLANGEYEETPVSEIRFGYRHSDLHGRVVVRGTVKLTPGEPASTLATVAEHTNWRRQNQPGGRSTGSVFKNPPGDSAGRLVESTGLKGYRVGGAEVSPVHANFIVADEGATAEDVAAVIRHVRKTVAEQTGVTLECEVRFIPRNLQVDLEGLGGVGELD